MTPERWQRVQDLYLRALDAPAAGREEFVQREASDPELAQQVLRMLAVDTQSGAAFVDRPAASLGNLAPAGWPSPGDRLAERYVIERELGAGGMGRVFAARDEQLATRVALKIIHPQLAAIPKVLERFKAEIQLSRQVTHPNVCRVFDLGVARHAGADVHFLTMEFMDGETLAARLRREGRIPFATARPWLEQIAAGLDAAHAAGVVHRDLKSSNVFLAQDRAGSIKAVVADFGVAGSFGEGGDARRTTTGWGVGTPAYMAPEQVMGGTVGPAADIYAFGIVMYEMATGVLPYAGETPLQVAVRRVREKPAPPRSFQADVDPRWEKVILRCLETDPHDRFASAGAAARELEAAPWLPRVNQRTWRRGAVAAAVLALVAAAGWAVRDWRSPEPPSAEALSWYQRGLPALYDGNPYPAEAAFQQAVKASPKFAEAHVRLAEAQLEMERLDDARASLLAGVATGAFRPGDQLHADAVLAFLNRETEKAVELIARRSAEAGEADKAVALQDQARLLLRESKFGPAAEVLRQLVQRDPGNRWAQIQLGWAHGRGGQAPLAERSFAEAEAALKKLPDAGLTQDLAYWRANLAQSTGQGDTMLPLAEEADRLAQAGGEDFRRIRARQLLAAVRGRQGDRPGAIRDLEAALQEADSRNLDLPAVRILIDLSMQLSAQSRLKEQMAMLRQAAERAGKLGAVRTEARVTIDLAQALNESGRPEDLAEAEKLLNRLEPLVNRPEAHDHGLYVLGVHGRLAARQGRFAEALRYFDRQGQEALRWNDPYHQMYSAAYRADVLRRLGRFVEAATANRRAKELAHGLKAPGKELESGVDEAENHLILGDLAAARRELEQLRPLLRPGPELFYYEESMNLLLREEGKLPEAEQQAASNAAAAAKAKNEKSSRVFALLACRVAGDALDPKAIRDRCAPLAGEARFTAAQRNGAQRALAAGAYWSKDYATAFRLAESVWQSAQASGDRPNGWEALLVLAAAERKLPPPASAYRPQLDAWLAQFGRDNGPERIAPFLARRPFQPYLREIGYPASSPSLN